MKYKLTIKHSETGETYINNWISAANPFHLVRQVENIILDKGWVKKDCTIDYESEDKC